MSRLVIEPIELHWLNRECPNEDLCAHGGVSIVLHGIEIFRTKEKSLSVSTGALHLLRHVTVDHMNSDEDHLFPCCAFEMLVDDGKVKNIGCGHGDDWKIVHAGGDVTLDFYGGPTIKVSAKDWRDAVLKFSSDVRSFYFEERKRPGTGDREWFAAFTAEWAERHASLDPT